MRNRAQRREYERQIKKDKRASKCPLCKHNALFFTQARIHPEAEEKLQNGEKLEKEDMDVVLICENCGQVVHDEPEVGQLLQPGVYLPLKLDIFEYALRHPDVVNMEPDAEAVVDRIIDGEFTEVE